MTMGNSKLTKVILDSDEKWEPINEERKEFFILQKKYGLGESAAMVYCKYRNDVLASSNLKDIVQLSTRKITIAVARIAQEMQNKL